MVSDGGCRGSTGSTQQTAGPAGCAALRPPLSAQARALARRGMPTPPSAARSSHRARVGRRGECVSGGDPSGLSRRWVHLEPAEMVRVACEPVEQRPALRSTSPRRRGRRRATTSRSPAKSWLWQPEARGGRLTTTTTAVWSSPGAHLRRAAASARPGRRGPRGLRACASAR